MRAEHMCAEDSCVSIFFLSCFFLGRWFVLDSQQVQGRVPREARRQARLHVRLRQGVDAGAAQEPRGQRLHPGRKHRLPRFRRRVRRSLHRYRTRRARAAKHGEHELRAGGERHRRIRTEGAQGTDRHGGATHKQSFGTGIMRDARQASRHTRASRCACGMACRRCV